MSSEEHHSAMDSDRPRGWDVSVWTENSTLVFFGLENENGDTEDVAKYGVWAGFGERKAGWKKGVCIVGGTKPCMPPCRDNSSQNPEGAI